MMQCAIGHPPQRKHIDEVVFAVTSANQDHSRYNPVPFTYRALGIDRLMSGMEEIIDCPWDIIGIPHYPPSQDFAKITLKEIQAQSEGRLDLTPENTVVLCSTPKVIEMYYQLGFAILTAELATADPEKYHTPTPNHVLSQLARSSPDWAKDPAFTKLLSDATYFLWRNYPQVPKKARWLFNEPVLNEGGGLTSDRRYSIYSEAMASKAVLDMKYDDIKDAIVEGKIVDEGCADGALLTRIAKGFPDSDLLGIEIASEFIARCNERQRAGEFGGSYVHFFQRNLTEPIFEPGSISTTICNSTTHELWSYINQGATLEDYLALKFKQLRPGGRLIIRDVVGPEHGDQEILMWCDDKDGKNQNIYADFEKSSDLRAHLNYLSTYSRFRRFSMDFLAQMRRSGRRTPDTQIHYQRVPVNGDICVRLKLKDAVEFMTKKDYTDNWYSEMNEEFAFWDFPRWKSALNRAGFTLVENNQNPSLCSRAYTNPWIVDNRWKGKVELYRLPKSFEKVNSRKDLKKMAYPVTNVVLIAQKQ